MGSADWESAGAQQKREADAEYKAAQACVFPLSFYSWNFCAGD